MVFVTLHFFVLCLFYSSSSPQRVRTCFNGSIRGVVGITNLVDRVETNVNLNTSSLVLNLNISWDVVTPAGVVLDGFIYHLQESIIGTSEPSIPANNVCNPGNESYWLNSNDELCFNDSNSCVNSEQNNSSVTQVCPITVKSLDSPCRGTGNFYINDLGFISVPANVRSLLFDIDFHTPYSIVILAYYREFVNNLDLNSGGGVLDIDVTQDCPSLLSNQTNFDFTEATQFCCDRDVPHVVARNVTFHELIPDFNTDSVSYVIRWLPPLFSNQLSGFQVLYSAGGVIQVNQSSSFNLTNDEISLLTSCDNTSVYYTTTLTGLSPTQNYELRIRTTYMDPELFECFRGYCDYESEFSVPELNPCNGSFGFCSDIAQCEAVNETGFPTLNSNCVCPEGYTGNGINETQSPQGNGCSPINFCAIGISPCSNGALCQNLDPSVMGATCSCLPGYFGDGLLEGSGCLHVSVVVLSVTIPILFLLFVLIVFILRRVYLRRRKREEFAWEAFIANDALKEFSIINQLGTGNDDGVWLPTFGEKWEIDRTKLQVGDVVGRGNYGVVYKGLYQLEDENNYQTEIPVAVKTVKEGANEDMRIKEFLTEIGFMINIGSHPNILKVIGCCTTQKPVFLVTDYLKYGDLLHFLWDAREPSASLVDPVYNVTEASLYKMAIQVAEGMDYLTKSRIIHGDLAARNILVGEDLLCKISDFGLANDVYRYGVIQGQSERCVPYKWISPERMMAGKVPITSKSDVWSFGNLLYEMITLGCMPHTKVPTDELLDRLKDGYRMKQPSTCSNDMHSIMTKCWKWRPSSRPSFSQLVKSLEGAKEALEKTKYVNLVEMVDDLNKTIYKEEIREKKEIIAMENREAENKLEDINVQHTII